MRNPYSELVSQARAASDTEALQWATMAYDTFHIGAARAAAGNASLARQRLQELQVQAVQTFPTYYHCGICDAYHDAAWDGDCRQDNARHNPEEIDALHGEFGWCEIDMDDVDAWRDGGVQFYGERP